jgi:PAS domain S-box-containing protein
MQAAIESPLVILDTIPEAYLRVDSELRFTFVNHAAQVRLGATRAQLLGKRLEDVFPGKRVERAVRRVLNKQSAAAFDLYSEKHTKRTSITAMPDSTGGVVMRLADPHAADQSESQSRLHAIASNLPGFVYQTYVRDDGSVGVSFADRRALEIFGVDPEPLETCYKRFAACIAPEDQERFRAATREATLHTGQLTFEGRFITPAGEEKYIRAVSRSRRSGTETVHDGIVLDITGHWRAEQALRQSEELYRELFEVESDALVLVDYETGRILAANAAAQDLYGYSRQELISLNRLDLSAEPEATLRSTMLKTSFIPLRWHRKKDGTVFPVEISGRYFDWKGRSVFVSAIRDITGRTHMEMALKKSEEKFSKAFYSNPAAIAIADRASRKLLDVNHTFEKMVGYPREEVIGRTTEELSFWAEAPERDRAIAALALEGSLRDWEFRFRRKNGDICTGLLSAEMIEIEGRPCTISSIVDITEHLQLESQFRQAQKLESLGRLAGGVAHDFNNLLTVINGYSEIMLASVASDNPLHASAQAIKKAGERAAALTQQLLAFSRKQMIQPRPVDVNAIVADSEGIFQRLIGEDIELTTRLEPSAGRILADPGQIYQVLINMVVNARDAMPDGGALEIVTRSAVIDPSHVHRDAVPGRYVLITITDTGIGMDESTAQCVFEPFFTTKEPGKGTGLGLSTAHGIVRQGGGWIEVRTKVGQGSSFEIYWPQKDEPPAAETAAQPSAKRALDGETVLVVEDDQEVRHLIAAILKDSGYHVIEAGDGDEALDVERLHPAAIQLLLTDLVLPGMNGKALYERLRVLRPDLKVLFVSGYTADVISRSGLEQHMAYLQKPFDTRSLSAKVREVLTQGTASPERP